MDLNNSIEFIYFNELKWNVLHNGSLQKRVQSNSFNRMSASHFILIFPSSSDFFPFITAITS